MMLKIKTAMQLTTSFCPHWDDPREEEVCPQCYWGTPDKECRIFKILRDKEVYDRVFDTDGKEGVYRIPPINKYLDPEVIPMVKLIRDMGFKTITSCGGHKNNYSGASARQPFGTFYVCFKGTDTLHVDEFKNYLFEKTGGKTSLKFKHEFGRKSNIGVFYGKIKAFHKIFPNKQEGERTV